jgi:hypothetical protein
MKQPGISPLNVAISAIAIIGILLIMLGMVLVMYHYTRPAPVDEARMAERRKNLAELNAQTKDVLEHYAWIDQTKGQVRLPVARAMELAASEWQQPAAARSNLLWRLERVTPPPPLTPPTNSVSVSTNKP